MESYKLSETSVEEDDPNTLVMDQWKSLEFKGYTSPLSIDDRVKGKWKTSHHLNQPHISEHGKIFNLPETFFDSQRNRLLLRQCRQAAIEVVKCDSHEWFHRRLIESQELDPKVSVSMKRYLDKTDISKDNIDETNLRQSNVRILGGTGKPSVIQSKASSEPARKALLEPQPVGNFMVCDNSVMTKRSSVSRDAQIHPVKLKIKEILTIKEMSSKRLSQIDFKKNKGLVGMKISRESIDHAEIKDKRWISTKKIVKDSMPIKMVEQVKTVEKPGPKRTKKKLSNKHLSKCSFLSTSNLARNGNDKIIKPRMQTIEESNTTTVRNNPQYCPFEGPNVTKQNEPLKALEKNENKNSIPSINTLVTENTVQVCNNLVSEIPNNPVTNESPQVIAEIKTENEIKKEVAPDVTNMYKDVNQMPFLGVRIRPALHQEEPQEPNTNHNQHLHNNALLPAPYQYFRNPSEIAQNYSQPQPNWQQYQHINTHNHLQIPSLIGPITQQYPPANMQWINPQDDVNVNGHYQNHVNFQGHQNQMMTPLSTQVNLSNTILPPQCSNPMMPAPYQYNANILAPTQNTLTNKNTAAATSQGVSIQNMHLPAPPYPDHLRNYVPLPVQGNVTNSASDFLDSRSFSQSSVINTNTTPHNIGACASKAKVIGSSKRKVLLTYPYQSVSEITSSITPNAPISNASTTNRKNPQNIKVLLNSVDKGSVDKVSLSNVKVTASSTQKGLRVSQNTSLTWSNTPFANATTTNWANPHNSVIMSNTVGYPYKNEVNNQQLNAYDCTNPNYAKHFLTQLTAPMYPNNPVNEVLTNDTGEIKKVILVAIQKKRSGNTIPSVHKELREKLAARCIPGVGTTIQGHFNPYTTELPTKIVNPENATNIQSAKSNVNNSKRKSKVNPTKRATHGKKVGPVKKVKVADFGVGWTENSEVIPKGYSPPILPLPSVRKTYEILMNSQQLRFRQNTLSPATMEIMEKSMENTWPPSHFEIDSKTEKEKPVKDVKKISLNEYKKQAAKSDGKIIDLTDENNQTNMQNGKKINNETNNGEAENNERRSIDSQDLGYGSDIQYGF